MLMLSVDAISGMLCVLQLLSGSTDTTSDHASYTIAAGNNAVTMTNTRLFHASPPISGTFSVSFNGVSSQGE